MILSNPNHSITAILSGAASPAPTYVTAFHFGAGYQSQNGTLSATAATIVSAPSPSSSIIVDTIIIHNSDNASISPTLTFVDDTNSRIIWEGTLLTGETLFYTFGDGFRVVDTAGRTKTSAIPTLGDGEDIVLGTTTGTKIGTGVTQKLGLWGSTPVIQQASANQAVVVQSQTALTDNGGGTADGTVVVMTAAGTITDNSGGSNATDTIAAITGVDGAGSNAASLADTKAAINCLALHQNTTSTAIGAIKDNVKEVTTELALIKTDVTSTLVLVHAIRTALTAIGAIKGAA